MFGTIMKNGICFYLLALFLLPVETYAQEDKTDEAVKKLAERVSALEKKEFYKMLRPVNDIDFMYDAVLGFGKHKIVETRECQEMLAGYKDGNKPVIFERNRLFYPNKLQNADGVNLEYSSTLPSLCKLAAVERALGIDDSRLATEIALELYKTREDILKQVQDEETVRSLGGSMKDALAQELSTMKEVVDTVITGLDVLKQSENSLSMAEGDLSDSVNKAVAILDAVKVNGDDAANADRTQKKQQLRTTFDRAKSAVKNAVDLSQKKTSTVDTTIDRIHRVYEAINYSEWKTDRLRFGLMAAQIDKLEGLSTSIVLHGYPAYRRFMPGQLDLGRRFSFFFGVGTVANENESTETKGPVYSAGLGIDIAKGFTVLVGYSLYQSKDAGASGFSQGDSLQYGFSLTSDLWKGLFQL